MKERSERGDTVESFGEFEFRDVGELEFGVRNVFARHIEHAFGVVDTQIVGRPFPEFHSITPVTASDFQNVGRLFADMFEYPVDVR